MLRVLRALERVVYPLLLDATELRNLLGKLIPAPANDRFHLSLEVKCKLSLRSEL